MTEKPLQRCPKCRGKVARLIGTGAGIIFKGSGFYATDYRSDSYKSAARTDSASSSASSSKSDVKSSSSKTETTTTSKI